MQYGGDLPDKEDHRTDLRNRYLRFADLYNSHVQKDKISERAQSEALEFLKRGDIDAFLRRFRNVRDMRAKNVATPLPGWMNAPEEACDFDFRWLRRQGLEKLGTSQWDAIKKCHREGFLMLIRRHYQLDTASEVEEAAKLLDLIFLKNKKSFSEKFWEMASERCTGSHAMQPKSCKGILCDDGDAIDAQLEMADEQLFRDCGELPRDIEPSAETLEAKDDQSDEDQSSSASTSSFSRSRKNRDLAGYTYDSESMASSTDRQETPDGTCASPPEPQKPSDGSSTMDISEDEQLPRECGKSPGHLEVKDDESYQSGTWEMADEVQDGESYQSDTQEMVDEQLSRDGAKLARDIEPSAETLEASRTKEGRSLAGHTNDSENMAPSADRQETPEPQESSDCGSAMDFSEAKQGPLNSLDCCASTSDYGGDLPDSHKEAAEKRRAELERRYLDFRESYNSHVQKRKLKKESKNSAVSFLKDGDIDAFLRRFKYIRDRRRGDVAEPPPDWMKAPEETDKWDLTWLQQRKGLEELGTTRWWEANESSRESYLRLIRRHYQLDTASELEQAAKLLNSLLSNKVSSFTVNFQQMIDERCKCNHRTKPSSCKNLNYWDGAATEAIDAQLANCFNTDDEWSESDTQEANEQLPRECESMAPSADRQETPANTCASPTEPQEPSDCGSAMDISEEPSDPSDCSASTSEAMEDAGTTPQEADAASRVPGSPDAYDEGGSRSIDFARQKTADSCSQTDEAPLLPGQLDPPQSDTFRLVVQDAAGRTALPRMRSTKGKKIGIIPRERGRRDTKGENIGTIERKRGRGDGSSTCTPAPPKRQRQREDLRPSPPEEETEKKKHSDVAKRVADSEMLKRATDYLCVKEPKEESYYILLIDMIRGGKLTAGELPESAQRILSPFLDQLPEVAPEVNPASSDPGCLEQWYALCGPWHPLYYWQPSFKEFKEGLSGKAPGSSAYRKEFSTVIENFRTTVRDEVPYLKDVERGILWDADQKAQQERREPQNGPGRGLHRPERRRQGNTAGVQFRTSKQKVKTNRRQLLAKVEMAEKRGAFDNYQLPPSTNEQDQGTCDFDQDIEAALHRDDTVTRWADAEHDEYVAGLKGALAQSGKDLSDARTELSEVKSKLAALQDEKRELEKSQVSAMEQQSRAHQLSARLDLIASLSQPSIEAIFSDLQQTGRLCTPVVACFHSLLCGCGGWEPREADASRCGEVFRRLHAQAVQPEDGLLDKHCESIVAHIVESKQTIERLQSEGHKARAEAKHHQQLHEAQREALKSYDRLHNAIRETSGVTRKKPLTDTSGLEEQFKQDLRALEDSRKAAQGALSASKAANQSLAEQVAGLEKKTTGLKEVNASILAAKSTCEAEAEHLSKQLAGSKESTVKLTSLCMSQITARRGRGEEGDQQKLWNEQTAEVQRAISMLTDDQTQSWQDWQGKLTKSVEGLCRLDIEIPQCQSLIADREAAERARLDVIRWLLQPDELDMGPMLREGGLWCQLMLNRVGEEESLSSLDPPVVRETEQYILCRPVFERIAKLQADAACAESVLSRTESLKSSPNTYQAETAEEETKAQRFATILRWLPAREVKRIALLELLLQQQTQPEAVLSALEEAQLQYRSVVVCLHWALCSCSNMEPDMARCSDFYTQVMTQTRETQPQSSKDETRAYGRCFSSLGKFKTEIQRLKRAEGESLKGLTSLQEKKISLQQEIEEVRAELASVETESTDNQAQRKAAEATLVEADKQRTDLRARLETAEKGYREDLKRHREASDTARAKAAAAEKKLEASETETKRLAKEKQALQQSTEELTKSVATLSKEIVGLRQRLLSEDDPACVFPVDENAEPIELYEDLEERLRRELSSATSGHSEALERIEELERSLTNKADELKSEVAKHREAEAEWQRQKEHAVDRSSKLQTDLETEKGLAANVKSALEAKAQELTRALTEASEAQTEAQELRAALDSTRSDLRTAQEQLRLETDSKRKEEDAKTKLEVLSQDLKRQITELEAGGDLTEFQKRHKGRLLEITSPLEHGRKTAEHSLQKSEERCSTLVKELEQVQEERRTAVQDAQIAQKKIARLERELQRAKNRLGAKAALVRSYSMPATAEMPRVLDGPHSSIHAEIQRLREEGRDNEKIFGIVAQQVATERLGEELKLVKAFLVQTQRHLQTSEDARKTLDAKAVAAEKEKDESLQMLQECREENERLGASLRDVLAPSLRRLDKLMFGAEASAAPVWSSIGETVPTVEAVASAVKHHVQMIEGLHSDVTADLTHGLSKAVLTLQANADAYANLVSSLNSVVGIFQQCRTWLAETPKPHQDYSSAPQEIRSAIDVLDRPADPASLLSRFGSQDTATKLGRECICLVIQCARSRLGTPTAPLSPESDRATVDRPPAEQAQAVEEYVTPQAEDAAPCFGVDSAEHSVVASLNLFEDQAATENTEQPWHSGFQATRLTLQDEATQTSDCSCRDCCSALEKPRHTAYRLKQSKKELETTLKDIRACLEIVRAEFASAEKYLLNNGESKSTNTRVLGLFDRDDCSAEDINERLAFHGAASDHRSEECVQLSEALSAVVRFATTKDAQRVDMIREMLSCTRPGVFPRDRGWEQQLRVHKMDWAESRAALQACGIAMESRYVPSRCKDPPLPEAYKRLFQEIELMATENTKLKTSQKDQAVQAVSVADTTPYTGEANAEHSVVASRPASLNLNFELEAATEETEQPHRAKRQSEFQSARPALQDEATQTSDCSCRDCRTAMEKLRSKAKRRKQSLVELMIQLDTVVTSLQDARRKFTAANRWLVYHREPSADDEEVLQLFDRGRCSTDDIDRVLNPRRNEYPYTELSRALSAVVCFATTKETQRVEIAWKMLSWTTLGVLPSNTQWQRQLRNHHMQCPESAAALQACNIATEDPCTGTGSSAWPPQVYRRLFQNIALVARNNAKTMTIQKDPAVEAALDCCGAQDDLERQKRRRHGEWCLQSAVDGHDNSNDTPIRQPKKLWLSIPESDTIVLDNEEWGICGVAPAVRGQKCNIQIIRKSCTRNKLGEVELTFKTSDVMDMIRRLDAADAKDVAKRVYDFCKQYGPETWLLPSGVRFETARPLRTNPSKYKVTYYDEKERSLCLYQLYDMGEHVRAVVGSKVIRQFEMEREKRKARDKNKL